MSEQSAIERLLAHLSLEGGRLVICWDPEATAGAMVGYEFGREAPDSDMAGGASYAVGDSLEQCLESVALEVVR